MEGIDEVERIDEVKAVEGAEAVDGVDENRRRRGRVRRAGRGYANASIGGHAHTRLRSPYA